MLFFSNKALYFERRPYRYNYKIIKKDKFVIQSVDFYFGLYNIYLHMTAFQAIYLFNHQGKGTDLFPQYNRFLS